MVDRLGLRVGDAEVRGQRSGVRGQLRARDRSRAWGKGGEGCGEKQKSLGGKDEGGNLKLETRGRQDDRMTGGSREKAEIGKAES
jgi:hypothetical protein